VAYCGAVRYVCLDIAQHDGSLSISESRAIAWYIARKADSSLVPPADDLSAMARFQQAASVEAVSFDAAASEIAIQRVFKVMRGGTTDEARVQVLAASLEATIVGYERILGERKYLAGDTLSIVDLFHLSHGSMLAPQGFTWLEDEQRFPNVARYAFLGLWADDCLTKCAQIGGGETLASGRLGARWWRDHMIEQLNDLPSVITAPNLLGLLMLNARFECYIS
jgi:glutathione S-transferase